MTDLINLNALNKIQYGMYIITTKCDDKINGQIASVVFQVTSTPAQLVVCLSKNTYTHELVLRSKAIGISVLAQETPIKLIGLFGYRCGRSCFKFDGINYETGITGVPLITDNALAIIEIEVKKVMDLESHTLFAGELKSSRVLRDGVAMTYEYYHTVKKLNSPENAPTFQKH